MNQGLGNKMKEDFDSKQSIKFKIRIPPKLPTSLARKVCNPLWKTIIDSIENKDVETVLEIIKTIDRQKQILCIPHPFIEDVDTFPVKSMRQGMCNFIFFNDESNQNQWILCQCTSFVDAIFSEKYSGKHKLSTDQSVILNSIKQVVKKENNTDVETKGYEAPFGINYYFPAPTGDLNEDWQLSSRFGDVRWYEQSGLIPTYPSNHPDESSDPQRSPSPKERVYGYQGSRDAAGAANGLETGSPKSSVDGSSDQAFSNASDSTNTTYVLGIQNAFLHYYEDDYGFVYKPGGKTGPTRTLVNEYEALNFNDRHKHGGNRPGRISDKADKIFGSPSVADEKYKHSAYVTRETPDADEETTEGLSASGYTPFGGRIGEN